MKKIDFEKDLLGVDDSKVEEIAPKPEIKKRSDDVFNYLSKKVIVSFSF